MATLRRAQRLELYARYMQGQTLGTLAAEYGVSYDHARYYVRKGQEGRLEQVRAQKLYSVYDRRNGVQVADRLSARECAERMGIKVTAFRKTVDYSLAGMSKRWKIKIVGGGDED